MNYMAYHPVDVVNGNGVRCTLFVSGCSHGCGGCYNSDSWNPKHGQEFTQECEDRIIADLQDASKVRQGLSLSGGDPMYYRNRPAILKLVQRVKSECPDKDIWLWTGYVKEQCLADPEMKAILEHVDVLIDGKFEKDKYDPELQWRGSSNQQIIKVRDIL